MTVGVVVRNKRIQAPHEYHLHIHREQEYTGFTEITFMIAMEINDDWLANKKTWTKWTRVGDVGSLQVKSLARQSCPNCSVHCQCWGPRGAIPCSLSSVELKNY
jgi:hypothetical protein